MPVDPERKIIIPEQKIVAGQEKKPTYADVQNRLAEIDVHDAINEAYMAALLHEVDTMINFEIGDRQTAQALLDEFEAELQDLYRALGLTQPGDNLQKIERKIKEIVGPYLKDRFFSQTGELTKADEDEAVFELRGEHFVCRHEHSLVKEMQYHGQKIVFEKPFSSKHLNRVAENIINAWRQIDAQYAFVPSPSTSFVSQDGFRFFAEGYCVSPLDVLKVAEYPKPEVVRECAKIGVRLSYLQEEMSIIFSKYPNAIELFHKDFKKLLQTHPSKDKMCAVYPRLNEIFNDHTEAYEMLLEYGDLSKEMAQKYAAGATTTYIDSTGEVVTEAPMDSDTILRTYKEGQREKQYSISAGKVERISLSRNGVIYEESFFAGNTRLIKIVNSPDGTLQRSQTFDGKTGTILVDKNYRDKQVNIFDANGNILCVYQYDKEDRHLIVPKSIYMPDDKRGSVSDYHTERAKTPEMTPDEYLDMLARTLNTHAKLRAFFEIFMSYVHDSNDPKNLLKKGTEEDHGEYWQLATETINRVENAKMLGDCDDYAFLAREICRRQGKHAVVISLPEHAECLWIEKVGQKYKGCTLGTSGLDEQEGASIDEVLSKLFVKFSESALGVREGFDYAVENGMVTVLEVPAQGVRQEYSLPVEVLEDRNLYQKIIKAYAGDNFGLQEVLSYAGKNGKIDLILNFGHIFSSQRKFNEAARIYAVAVKMKPNSVIYNELLQAQISAGQFKEALATYTKAQDLFRSRIFTRESVDSLDTTLFSDADRDTKLAAHDFAVKIFEDLIGFHTQRTSYSLVVMHYTFYEEALKGLGYFNEAKKVRERLKRIPV